MPTKKEKSDQQLIVETAENPERCIFPNYRLVGRLVGRPGQEPLALMLTLEWFNPENQEGWKQIPLAYSELCKIIKLDGSPAVAHLNDLMESVERWENRGAE